MGKSRENVVSLQRYSYFILILFLGYSWIYFAAWKALESGSRERFALSKMQTQVSSLEKDNYRLLYQIDDLAQTIAQQQGKNMANVRSLASIDMSPLSERRFSSIQTLFQKENYALVLSESKKFENDFPLATQRGALWILKAKALLKQSKTEEAVALLGNVLEVYPEQNQSAEALEILSDVSLTYEKRSDAIGYLRIIEKQFPDYFKMQGLKSKLASISKGAQSDE